MLLEIIMIGVSLSVLAFVAYELGKEAGIDIGIKQTYDAWAHRIEFGNIEDNYVVSTVELPKRVDQYDYKFKKKWKKFNRHNRKQWYFGDLCKIPKAKKKQFPKCEINKLCKELEEKYGIREEVRD